jgi:LysR family nitrogen assimilation transcriptional regulator
MTMTRMDLKQLDYFVHVAELGSFTRAATVLRVAQPALSRQVRSLEVELRQALFDRNGRGVTLTEAGKRLLAHGRGILQQVERAKQDLEDQRGAVSGRLALGLPPSISRTLTGPLVEAFRERFPKATLTVVEGLSAYALEWLVLGRIDCAVVYNVTPAAAIDLMPVLDEPLYLVSARRRGAPKTASLDELAALDLVMPSRPHSIRMLLETVLAGQGRKPRIAHEIESVPAIALHGREAAFDARPVVVAPGQRLAASLWLATSSQRPRGPLVDQGAALLKQLLQRLVGDAAARESVSRPRR